MVLKELRITLYDVLGYFAPGLVLLSALGVFLWSLSGQCRVELGLAPSWLFSLADIFAAYLLGHLAHLPVVLFFKYRAEGFFIKPGLQGLGRTEQGGSRLTRLVNRLLGERTLSEATVVILERALRTYYQDPMIDRENSDLYRLCDAVLSITGSQEDREIFRSREGFYAGSISSFLLLTLALWWVLCGRMPSCGNGLLVEFGQQGSVQVSWGQLLAVTICSFVAFIGSGVRYVEFSNHRVRAALLGFAAHAQAALHGSASSGSIR